MTARENRNATRRQFLKDAAAGAVGAAALPMIVPASALGLEGKAAPSERIVVGTIGTGGQGKGIMGQMLGQPDTQVVAVCDVDKRHLNSGLAMVNEKYGNKDCKAYADFRELVARKDLDAVQVTTPDHWHALASIAALNAGKDVYCEKPLANSVGEGRGIADAAKKNNRVLQTGSHERSGDNARYACELVRNGRIGKVHTVEINLPCDDGHHKRVRSIKGVPPEMPIPDGFDYDFWLGHTPKVPYTELRCHFHWRFILNYGGGEMTDRGAHVIDIAQLGLDMDDSGPVEFECKGVQNAGSMFNVFWDYEFVNTYANGVKMIGSAKGPRGLKFIGPDGWIFIHIHGARLEASNPDLLKSKIADNEVHLGRSPGHVRNFLDSVKSRKQPVASAEIGHRTASICHLNNIAMLVGRTLKWDPKRECFDDDAEATALLTPKMREPWKLG
jgi:predicted dehydrogenase